MKETETGRKTDRHNYERDRDREKDGQTYL